MLASKNASTARFAQRPCASIARAAGPVRARTVEVNALFGSKPSGSFYDFEVKDIDGKVVKLEKFKGKACLVVNLASACGFTPQYADLQALHSKYSSKGFTVIGFPCNQFGAQEPGSNNEIKRFASSNYGVTFPLMSKINVNGPEADPVFDWLKSQKGGLMGNDIKWNFSKFLVDKDGNVVGRFPSTAAGAQLESEISKYL